MKKTKLTRITLVVLLLAIASVWLIETPPGLDGKLTAIGFSVCHQIGSHSLEIGGRLLPLCARCTGMYHGSLAALLYLANGKKRSGIPSKARIIALAVLFALFVVDGTNSMLSSFFEVPPLYPPSNFLRLVFGLVMGIILANLILPLWNQTLWKNPDPKPAFSSWKQLGFLLLIETVVGVLVWLDIPFLYYPIAILSTGMIVVILSMVYTLLWTIILNKECSLEKFTQGWYLYIMGVICAIAQIGLMDLIRFRIIGSWTGFQI